MCFTTRDFLYSQLFFFGNKSSQHGYLLSTEWHHAEETPADSPLDLKTAIGAGHLMDCKSKHQQAIQESIKSGVSNAFIPECDTNGDYHPIQCYKVGYLETNTTQIATLC